MQYTISDAGSYSGTIGTLDLYRPYSSREWLVAAAAPLLGLDKDSAVWVRGESYDDGDCNEVTDWYLYACQDDADADQDGSAAVLVAVAS